MKAPAWLTIVLLSLPFPCLAGSGPPATLTSTAATAELTPGGSLDIASDLTVRRLSDAAFLIRHQRPWPANSLVVEMGDGTLVLVSTPYTPRATEDLIAWMKGFFGQQRSILAINTHYHLDGMGGNQALRNANIPIYGSDLTVRASSESGPRMLEQVIGQVRDPELRKEFEKISLTPADKVFKAEEGLTLQIGKESVVAYYPGPAHSEDNSVVYFPAQRLLFGGCMVRDGSLGNTAEADLMKWTQSVRNLDRFDVEIVVPGHGDPGSKDLIRETSMLLGKQEEKTVN